MKRLTIALCALLVFSLCVLLSACVNDPAASTDTDSAETTVPATEAPTTPAEDPTEAPTEAPSETPTKAPTEAPTEPVTEVPYLLDIAKMEADAGTYFTRSSSCAATSADDATEGRVIRLSSEKINTPGKIPETYLNLSKLADALGTDLPDAGQYPYLAIKIKAGDVWSHTFSLYGARDTRNAKPSDMNAMYRARIDTTGDWQYIYFDLSKITDDIRTLFIQFEYGAGKNGEYVDIAEIRFLATEEEAIALCGSDVYELGEPTDTLRVISYNIWVGNGTDTVMRGDILADVLDTYRPDSIGLQEVNMAWKGVLESFVFNDSYAGVGEGRSEAYEACLLYYRVDKYELLDSGTFWLSDTPDVFGSAFPTSKYPRICTWVRLKDRTTGFEYAHLNIHLDHLSGADGHAVRGQQAEVLLNFVQSLGDIPMVVTGDFNSMSANNKGQPYKTYSLMTGAESITTADGTTFTSPFQDARIHAAETVPADRTATMTKYHDPNDDAYQPDRLPIDYEFYTPTHFEALSYNTYIFDRDSIPLSDHLAVICEYRILDGE